MASSTTACASISIRPTLPLKLDMTANASIIGEQAENVLAVPTKAIRTGRAANQAAAQSGQTMSTTATSMVVVLENGRPRPVPVTVGMTAGDLTEVSGDLEGIKSGGDDDDHHQQHERFWRARAPDRRGGPPPGGRWSAAGWSAAKHSPRTPVDCTTDHVDDADD